MKLPLTVPSAWMQKAEAGDSIVCAGHTSYSRTPLQKAGFKFTTNRAWLVHLSSAAPQPVTVLTIIERPKGA